MRYQRVINMFLCLTLGNLFFSISLTRASETKGAAAIERISPEDARAKVQRGEALLVCSYEDEKCKGILLEGALLKSEFERRVNAVSNKDEIIFYCG